MSTNWATSPGSVIDSNSYMGNDSKILRERKFEQQRMLQQQRQQQKRQVCDESLFGYFFRWTAPVNSFEIFFVLTHVFTGNWYGDTQHVSN